MLAVALSADHAADVSLLFQSLAPLLAMLAALKGCRETSARPSDGWSMVALAFLLWASGMAAPFVQARWASDSALVRYGDILLFVLYAVPLTWIASTPFRHRDTGAVQGLDGALALALGVLFFLLTISIVTGDGNTQGVSALRLAWLFDVENLFLLACIALRYWAASAAAERRLFLPLLVFATTYLLVAAFNNHIVTLILNAPVGSFYDVLTAIPFLLFVGTSYSLADAKVERRAPDARTRYVRSASPLMLCVAVLGAGLALARTHYDIGAAGVLVAVAGYGLRNVLRETRHVELRAMLSHKQTQLEAMTLVDALTGIPNRRALDKGLERECKAAARAGRPLGVLLIDIDFFKLLNDTSGHQAGDEGLRKVAQVLQAQLNRPEDLLARYGGEEFLVLLPHNDAQGCAGVAESLRQAIEAARIPNAGAPSGLLSVSVGVACAIPRSVEDRLTLLHAADEALYESKRGGRNRVTLAWNNSTIAPAQALLS